MPKSLMRALMALMIGALIVVAGQGTGVLAAETTGTLSGTVTDSAGHPLPNVAVSAVAPSMTSRTRTGANGFYVLTGLAPDTYTVTFSSEGYQSQEITGVTVVQGGNQRVSLSLSAEAKVLGRISVRSAASLIQPKSTSDTYTVNQQTIQQVTGTPQNISETALLNSLPGITTDNAGYPIIRGSAENEEGYELEGIDATDPDTGQFINSLSLAGTSRVVLSTGGYDVSAGNTNAGVVNEVISRGAYPGSGEITSTVNAPNFDHRLAFNYGSASPDNRFSYYFAFNGLRQYRVYGDTKTFLPRLVGAVGDASGNIGVTNLFYRWGRDNANELEYMGETGASIFDENFNIDPTTTPYETANREVIATYEADAGVDLTPFITLFPGQTSRSQFIGFPDNENNVHTIEKLNYKRQFSASSFGDLFVFRTIEADIFLTPWSGGAFGDSFEHNVNDNRGISFDYTNQVNSKHEIGLGGETVFSISKFDLGGESLEPFIWGPFAGATVDCYVDGVNAIFSFLCPGGATNNLFATYPTQTGLTNDPLHRSNLWIKDKFTPTDKLTFTAGVRWDQEVLDIPANAQAQNTTYVIDFAGDYVEQPGPAVTSDVTRPSQVSPRLAGSYELDPKNVFTASYGTNIEFTPFSNIEFKPDISQSLASCNMASGCFIPLPGFGTTNHVTNLYQQMIETWNTNNFGQYTPVKPQRAINYDFGWSHDFTNGLEMRIEPYYRKGSDYVVANTPLLTTLTDGTPVFGAPREENAGFNMNTGVEFALDKLASFGWSGFIHATYDNTLANYNSDFFPSTNNAALALGHVFHVSYLAPVTGAMNLSYNSHNGLHVAAEFPYESGYRYGVGKHTFIFESNCIAGAPAIPVEVLNTDLAENCLGNNFNTSAYYFTDPANPGTVLRPNITGSRGTPDGNDPGTLRGPQIMTMNLSISHDIGAGARATQVGFRVVNLLGNYSDANVGFNSRYRNNGIGGFSSTSGTNLVLPLFEPYQFPRSPLPFENEPTGTARTWTFFVDAKF